MLRREGVAFVGMGMLGVLRGFCSRHGGPTKTGEPTKTGDSAIESGGVKGAKSSSSINAEPAVLGSVHAIFD